ncbi:MAG: hypothetical protein M3271_01990 [Actinomycetota bacterium]|nr:hypothetical protein [Actinomycetota bacterium]
MLVRVLIVITTILAGCSPDAPPDADPAKSADVTYDVFPPTSQFGDSPRAMIRNTGAVPLEYPHDFLLETLYEGIWLTVRTPTDPNYPCSDFPSFGLVLHPGKAKSQRITACGSDGQPRPLFAGTYRVTKTVLTIPSGPEETPVEIEKVVEFEIAEPSGDIPGPDRCRVLCISDTHVEGGQTVRVSFTPPRRYSWGIPSELHAGTRATIWPVAFLYGRNTDEELITYWVGAAPAYVDIDLSGPARWRWEVPARLEPGLYSIVRDGIAGSVRVPIEDRTKTWTVSFEVNG